MSSGIALKDQTAGNASNLIIVHKNMVLWSICVKFVKLNNKSVGKYLQNPFQTGKQWVTIIFP